MFSDMFDFDDGYVGHCGGEDDWATLLSAAPESGDVLSAEGGLDKLTPKVRESILQSLLDYVSFSNRCAKFA